MASKTPTSLSELMTIRDILMGEIMNEYQDRFEKLEANLALQKKELEEKEAVLDEKIQQLNQMLQVKVTDLENSFDAKMEKRRQAIGAMFLSLGQQLKD